MKHAITILFITILFLPNYFAQTSPGGVSANLTLWLDAKDSVKREVYLQQMVEP